MATRTKRPETSARICRGMHICVGHTSPMVSREVVSAAIEMSSGTECRRSPLCHTSSRTRRGPVTQGERRGLGAEVLARAHSQFAQTLPGKSPEHTAVTMATKAAVSQWSWVYGQWRGGDSVGAHRICGARLGWFRHWFVLLCAQTSPQHQP